MHNDFSHDYFRKTGKQLSGLKKYKYLMRDHGLRYMYYHRKVISSNKNSFVYKMLRRNLLKKYGLEILSTKIGQGLYVGHAFNITVNPDAVIGKNCNIHKGVTIGQENRGKRKGTPTIGDHVWIGANASIVGKIFIGDNVLIAPNSYVNFDVPSDSVVIGNPAKIIKNIKATEGYINNAT
ncbi:serine O-acetyltransferase [Ruoffia sp. FAM 24228]|uniref:serine O-acetyltransferase n=1 Tax=Ruoffia sp. FAM 24228 TaxID=3259517 RepID=UPI00388A349D